MRVPVLFDVCISTPLNSLEESLLLSISFCGPFKRCARFAVAST